MIVGLLFIADALLPKPKVVFSVIFYGLKIILVSCLMILSMKLAQNLVVINNLNEVFLLISLCLFGFFIYILTSLIFKYIPQELYDFISLRFKKAK